MDREVNAGVVAIARRLLPCGFDLAADAPDSLEKLNAHVARTGRIQVWNGASDQTIFGDAEINYAFRAWHDWSHWRGQHAFTPRGEAAVARMQVTHIRALYGRGRVARKLARMVRAEVIGQIRHHLRHGAFPEDQASFAATYLLAPAAALWRVW